MIGGFVGVAAAARARCRRDTGNNVISPSQSSATTTSSVAGPAPTAFVLPSNLRIQARWQWCNKCQALAYSGFADLGPCPAGGVHEHAGSYDYPLIAQSDVVPASYQNYWRWCNKCQALAFAGNADSGSCSGGGVHDHSGSADYMVEIRGLDGLPSWKQDNWRWCNKCQVLAYAGLEGPCSAGGLHDHTGSSDYVLFH